LLSVMRMMVMSRSCSLYSENNCDHDDDGVMIMIVRCKHVTSTVDGRLEIDAIHGGCPVQGDVPVAVSVG
jgi:hypothetical protein